MQPVIDVWPADSAEPGAVSECDPVNVKQTFTEGNHMRHMMTDQRLLKAI